MLYYYIVNVRIISEYPMRFLTLCSTLAFTPVAAFAAPPQVATDVAPVHSLVAQVMGDLGTPDLILPPGASPHGYSMRPSEAAAIAGADLVVWVGEALTPWLERPIDNLSAGTPQLELLDVEGIQVFEGRVDAVFGGGHDDHNGHDDHAGHDDDDHKDEDAQVDHDDHDHDHSGTDPHAWLDPENASLWLGAIATALSDLDPENAAIYAANAAAAQAELTTLVTEITAQLAPVADQPHVVFHDAYQYFEARFGTKPLGAIAISDASTPSAARLSELRTALSKSGVVCVFAEPQFDPRLVAAVVEGTPARTAVLDPLGVDIPLGPEFYGTLIRGMATAKFDCLSGR